MCVVHTLSRSRLARVGPVALALAAALLLSGCQADVGDPDPTPPPAEPSSTSPSESPAALRSEPQPLLADGCDGLFSDAEVSRTTGGAEPRETGQFWQVAIETIGGLSCPFHSDSMAGEIVLLPANRASGTDQAIGAPGCGIDYDEAVCVASQTSGKVWVLVAMLVAGDEVPEDVTAPQTAVLQAVAATVRDVVPAGVDAEEVVLDCESLAERLGVTDVLENDVIYPTRIEEGSGPLERRIADHTGASVRCDWSELDSFRELGVLVIPGGAWARDAQAAAMPGSRDAAVAGVPATLWESPSGETGVLIADDGDLVWVWDRGVRESDLLSVAGVFLGA